MDSGTSQARPHPPLPPTPPPPPPASASPSPGPELETRGPAAGSSEAAGTVTPAQERIQIASPEQSQAGHIGGGGSEKNLLDSVDGVSAATHTPAGVRTNPFELGVESSSIPPPPPPRSKDGHRRMSRRVSMHPGNNSDLDYIIPVDHRQHRKTCSERIDPTIKAAEVELRKSQQKAMWTGYALNGAIGLQVLLGALTTAVAAALQTGRQAQISTSILGGASTLVASYLAKSRSSNEPQDSIVRSKVLEYFLRDCEAFRMDHGHEYGTEENGLNKRIYELRQRFEELIGNSDGKLLGSTEPGAKSEAATTTATATVTAAAKV
ncbi:hypothetical protein ID866_4266 [Astraeus odoratus]|nr:hypothetical protein ID866_4266 [Astraeus odoratus]